MAERDYMRGEGVTPIQDMSTRQLRRYIRERAEEAQERLNSMKDPEEAPRSWQEQLEFVSSFGLGRGGGIKKDTSRMDKITMAEYAYALRDLNMLDTYSKYSRDQDYKENKQRYQKFVRERSKDLSEKTREYWKQFILPSGNISKKGYIEYKNYINFLRNIDTVISTYGYEAVAEKYVEQTDMADREKIEELLLETWEENRNDKSHIGYDVGQLVDLFNSKWDDYKKEKRAEEEARKEAAKIQSRAPKKPKKGSKSTGKKSGTNVGIKQGAKMKNGRVREKQTTKKL